MRLQFVFRTDVENPIDINVVEVPTEYQLKAIEEEIYADMEKYIEESGEENLDNFDFYMCCYEAVKHHIHIAENRIVKTIYIM